MTPDQIDLARVLVMHPRFRWLAPMAAEDGDRVCPGRDEDPDRGWRRDGTILPDLTDPATAGCLLALVREAWGDPRLVAIYCEAAHPGQSEGWAVQRADGRLPVAGEDHETEAAALVAALEAA